MTEMDTDAIVRAVQDAVVAALELDVPPEGLATDAPLFGDPSQGGLGLDSLNALEVMYRVGDAFELPELFEAGNDEIGSIDAIARLVEQHLGEAARPGAGG